MNNHGWGNEPGDNNKGPRKQGDGPPDLEELWRDFTQRLGGLFGKKPRPGNNGGNTPPNLTSRQFGGGVGVIIALVVAVWLASGFYIVDASERGVVLRFGSYSQTTEPGLRWRMPWPIESHEVVNLSGVRRLEIGYRGSEKDQVLREALMLTHDLNIVNIQFAVQYLLKDEQQYLFNNRNPDEAVKQAAETAIREMVGKSNIDDVLSAQREKIASGTRVLMQDILDRYKTGIEITSVTMQKAQPPAQVQAAFDDAVKAKNDGARYVNEGEAYANDVIPRAQGTASRLMAEANGYKQRMIATAEGDASYFKQVLVEYNKAPEVMRTRMYLETMQQIYTNTSKVMIDAKGSGNLLYLPLDKLMAASVAASPTAQTDAQGRSAGMAATNPYESAIPPQVEKIPPVTGGAFSGNRDLTRNRERGER
ncbi:MAG TPA: FtsH protease activity modulator HflK [Rhodocyclaceae bacterium]|nr:FtsH protease activity modulator HflK [Rhodocyclaceae bacterium]